MDRTLVRLQFGVLCFLTAFCVEIFAQDLAPWVGANIPTGTDPSELPSGDGDNQAEPHAIRSQVDPDLILTTFQEGRYSDGGAISNGYAVSEDGGFNWNRALNPNLTQIAEGPYFRATDPVGAIDLNGTLYLNSLVSLDTNFSVGRVVVQRSEDRGRNWTDPITIYTGYSNAQNDRIFPDKNWMVVNDYPNTPTSGRLVSTWTNFRTIAVGGKNLNDFPIMLAHSDDKGSTWSEARFVTQPSSANVSNVQFQGSQPVFLPDGNLAVVFHNFRHTRLEVAYSPDGGASFPFAQQAIHSGYTLYDAPNMRDGSFLPSVQVARETGDLYVAYTSSLPVGIATTGAILFVRSSLDDLPGSSNPNWNFTSPLIIASNSPNFTTTPTLTVSPDGQTITVFFFDNRNDSGTNLTGDFYAVQSSDGGTTWSEPFRLTPSTFNITAATNTSRGYMLGDYYGLAAPTAEEPTALAIWVDTSLGDADPVTARIAPFNAEPFDSWLQANLPYAVHRKNPEDLKRADTDADGIPNLLEYIWGAPPNFHQLVFPSSPDPFQYLINAETDPNLSVEVRAYNADQLFRGIGVWPGRKTLVSDSPNLTPFGEGYWSQVSWDQSWELLEYNITQNGAETETWHYQSDFSLFEFNHPLVIAREFNNGWFHSPWFGFYYTREAPWLYHLHLKWIYVDGFGLIYSDYFKSFISVDLRSYPWIYRYDSANGWSNSIYLLSGTSWYWDSTTKQWHNFEQPRP